MEACARNRSSFFFQAEDGIRDYKVTEFRRVLFRSKFRLRGFPRFQIELKPSPCASSVSRCLLQLPHIFECSSGVVAKTSVLGDRKSTRLNSSHLVISYAVFCLKKKNAQLTLSLIPD